MNERIKELLCQAHLDAENPNDTNWIANRFAELIIKECCDWIDGAICSEEGMILLTKPFIISNLKNIFENKDVL